MNHRGLIQCLLTDALQMVPCHHLLVWTLGMIFQLFPSHSLNVLIPVGCLSFSEVEKQISKTTREEIVSQVDNSTEEIEKVCYLICNCCR